MGRCSRKLLACCSNRSGTEAAFLLIGCEETHNAIVIDPELDETDHYLALAAEKGVRLRFLLDTHTHAITSPARASWRASSRCRW